MKAVWTVLEILRWTTDFFARREVLSPRLDAELLLAHVLQIPRIQLYVQYERPLDAAERDAFRGLVRRRGAGEPVQYILGTQEFWSITLRVEPGVLIPRSDTEVLIEEAVQEAARLAADSDTPLRIADVGTGTGAITIALAKELPTAHLFAGDIAPVPLRLAPLNARDAGVDDRVTVVEADGLLGLWRAVGERPFDLVVSNPPYIRAADYEGLMREVRDHEPRVALVAGADGLDVIRPLIAAAADPRVLRPGGALLIEIGDTPQADAVRALAAEAGFETTRTRDDYTRRARVVVAVRQTQ